MHLLLLKTFFPGTTKILIPPKESSCITFKKLPRTKYRRSIQRRRKIPILTKSLLAGMRPLRNSHGVSTCGRMASNRPTNPPSRPLPAACVTGFRSSKISGLRTSKTGNSGASHSDPSALATHFFGFVFQWRDPDNRSGTRCVVLPNKHAICRQRLIHASLGETTKIIDQDNLANRINRQTGRSRSRLFDLS